MLVNAERAVEYDPARLALEEARTPAAERDRRTSRRLWAAITLARHVDVCDSILRGHSVRVELLDRAYLRRALRDGPLPDGEDYILVSNAMFDAVAEAGPLQPMTSE